MNRPPEADSIASHNKEHTLELPLDLFSAVENTTSNIPSLDKDQGVNGLEIPVAMIENETYVCEVTESSDKENETSKKDNKSNDQNKLAYTVIDVPPWHMCIFLGIQHYLTALGNNLSMPLILTKDLCLLHDSVTQSHFISTTFFVSGLATLLQVILGVRLPIAQGASPIFLTPVLTMLSLPEWECPKWTQNGSLVNTSSPEFIEVWQSRIREIQGAIMVASCVHIFLGFSGLIGLIMPFIGPLTIAPTICLIALPLYNSAGRDAGSHWGISAMTMFLIILFSQYLRNVPVPLPKYSRVKKCQFAKVKLFQIFPMLFAICISWLVCYILTTTNALPSDPARYGYLARTDVKAKALSEAPWFRFPYPGQWGRPTISIAGVCSMFAAVIATVVDTLGDYHAAARLAGAPPPPQHAINRGIGIEGIGLLLTGAWGSGTGTCSLGANIGAVRITKVGSRMVIVAAGIFMVLLGMLSKIGAVFATIPVPVIGGLFLVMFGVIAAVGISNLQFADMNSSRNIFIVGFSIFSGLTIPHWVNQNTPLLATGITQLDQVILVLLTSGMLVGGIFGFILDNTIPGTKEERGILAWKEEHGGESEETLDPAEVYALPFGIGTRFCTWPWIRFIPFCPKLKRTEPRPGTDLEDNHVNSLNQELETGH